MLAANADRWAPGDSFGIPTTSRADMPVAPAGPQKYLMPVLVLAAAALLLQRIFGRG